ncbi:MAG: hypothetical protein L0323_20825 [Planctomycetes bacterium]|nr:hypothetical protein [Planctomycetota bacterium]
MSPFHRLFSGAARAVVVASALLGTPSLGLAAGSCTASVSGGVLLVTGDADANAIFVTETPPGSGTWVVSGDLTTLINGLASDTLSGGVTNIVVDLGAGADLTTVSGEIPGSLTVFGGADRNEFLLIDSNVGGDVLVENAGSGETDFEGSFIAGNLTVVNGDGFDEFKLDAAEVAGTVLIDNGDGDALTGASSVTDGENDSVIGGDLLVENGVGFDALDIGDFSVDGTLFINNRDGDELSGLGSSTDIEAELGGLVWIINKDGFDEVEIEDSVCKDNVLVENNDGDAAGLGSDSSFGPGFFGGNLTVKNRDGFDEVGLKGAEILGSVDIRNYAGNALGEGSSVGVDDGTLVLGSLAVRSETGFDEVDVEEGSTIVGSVFIRVDGGGSGLDIENASMGSLKIQASTGFDAVNLDDTTIAGFADIRLGSGGSDFLTESSSGLAGVSIGSTLIYEVSGGIDTVTLDVLEVAAKTTIRTGSGDDLLTILNSAFNSFRAEGGSGIDLFTDLGGNAFVGSVVFESFP